MYLQVIQIFLSKGQHIIRAIELLCHCCLGNGLPARGCFAAGLHELCLPLVQGIQLQPTAAIASGVGHPLVAKRFSIKLVGLTNLQHCRGGKITASKQGGIYILNRALHLWRKDRLKTHTFQAEVTQHSS